MTPLRQKAFWRFVPAAFSGHLVTLLFGALLFASGISPGVAEDASSALTVREFRLVGDRLLVTNPPPASFFAQFSGTNSSLSGLTEAATALQAEYTRKGWTNVVVVVEDKRITNGIVTLNVFRGARAQIVVSGRRSYVTNQESVLLARPSGTDSAVGARSAATNAAPPAAAEKGPGFNVRAYEIRGDTHLSVETLTQILTNYVGTNITVSDIVKAAAALQSEYRDRALPTVNVTLPPQEITNGIVKIRVFEGRLASIQVVNNQYYSSSNVLRALPGLKPGMILNSRTFQAELDRANANQDRQIYPRLEPGPTEGTTLLRLRVEDRLPLHAKLELNNQSSPGTPALRLNGSAVYGNLWQSEHSLGVQYSGSPNDFKASEPWRFYDQPLVANYSAFYRMPLGAQTAVAEQIASKPWTFGFDEATRKFNLPPPSGRPELNLYASRATIDTGLLTLSDEKIQDIPGFLSISKNDLQQDLTINQNLGSRLSFPVTESPEFRSTFSLGPDYKTYELTSYKTNNFIVSVITLAENGLPNPPTVSTVTSPVPTTRRVLKYLPLSFRYDVSARDDLGMTAVGLGVSANAWYSDSLANLRNITGSSRSSGHWLILTPSLSRDFVFRTNWTLTVRADGQWANEPLISNEQFGAGGVSSVRGYQQGEVFGDTGWRVSLEQKTPAHLVGFINSKLPLTIRGSIYMDYAETYLLDPQGRAGHVPLWGGGVGGVISAGTHWEARFLFSLPLLQTSFTSAFAPRFDFGLTAQF